MQLEHLPQVFPLDDPVYPSADGNPMADNMLQYRWIVTVQGGIDALFRNDPAVLVAGNCLWYPVEGEPTTRMAPDVMVIFGRPKGDRGSYIQHREAGIPVQIVFEILSPGNRAGEMKRKLAFYERHGAEEYYILDPDFAKHRGYHRQGDKLEPIPDLFGWTSPRLGIQFEMTRRMKKELRILAPDGRPFEHYVDIAHKLDTTERQAEESDRRVLEERTRAEAERDRAEAERDRAEAERDRAEAERDRAEAERDRADRLLAQLRALGIEPEA